MAAGVLNVANARLIEIVQRVLESGEWRGDGIHSPAHWLAWRAGLSMGHAREIVAIADRRAEFPAMIAAFDRGELAVDQVAAVVKGAPAWADARRVGFRHAWHGGAVAVDDARPVLRRRPHNRRAEPEKPTVDRLSTGNIEGGRWRINGEADTEQGAIIDAALDEARDALFRDGKSDVSNVDALVEMAQRSLNAVGSVSRRERHRVWLHLDAHANMATTHGWRIPEAIAERILCDAVIQPVWETEGVPFNQGRTTRVIPPRLREAINRRDRGSRAPWDTSIKHTEVHHIIPVARVARPTPGT